MNYYNEHDPKAAAWLRELINAGLIPTGDVDERSIVDLQPDELRHYTQCHFFAGIGGWSLALQLADWPADGPVWTGSCPCQPFSTAGKGLGDKDERHLWPVFFNLIKECRPDVVFGEQVASAAVIGKRTSPEDVREVLDRKIVNGILREQIGSIQDALQGLRERENAGDTEGQLRGSQNIEAGDDSGICREVSGEEVQDTVRLGRGGHSEQDKQWSLRTDRDSVRVEDTESMEQPVAGSDSSRSWLHAEQCQGGPLFGECDESQLGAESDFEDFGFDQGAEEAEIERLIGETGGEPEEAAPVWLDGIQDDLEEAGYAFGSCVMAASSVGAPHIRQRLYWVADSDSGRLQQRDEGIGSVSKSNEDGADGWQRVVFSKDCDEDGNCPECGIDYADCKCPGPTQDGIEYGEFNGVLYGRLVNAVEQGLQRQYGSAEMELHRGEGSERSIGPTGFWDRYDIIPCRDGKSRRIECQSRGLADGIPSLLDSVRDAGATEEQIEAAINPFPLVKKQLGRTILLKGYGNAIVPQVAAEFVKAFLES